MGALTAERWEQAKGWFSVELLAKVKNLTVNPQWVGDTDRFTAVLQDGDRTTHVLVDAATATHEPAFDHEVVAKALTDLGVAGVTASALPLTGLRVDGTQRRFVLNGEHFACEADGSSLVRRPAPNPDVVLSPDETRAVLVKDHDLWLRDLTTFSERRLTTDGVAHFDYGHTGPDLSEVSRRRSGATRSPGGLVWSPDGRYLLALRTDRRALPDRPLIKEFAPTDQLYPVVTMGRFEVAGNFERAPRRLSVLDVETGGSAVVDLDGEQLQDFAAAHLATGNVWWDLPAAKAYFLTANRRGDTYGLVEVDLASGSTRQVYEETQDFYYSFNEHDYHRPNVHVLPDRGLFLWYSQRSGWGHLYVHDLSTGECVRPLTSGEWVVRDLLRVDEDFAYFTAGGREPGRNPYRRHLYRAALAGGEPQLLSPEDADHGFQNMSLSLFAGPASPSSLSPSGRFFVDTYSTLTEAPVTVVRHADGTLVGEIARADISALTEMGWQPPEPVTTLAADGETTLYGALFTPRDLDPAKSYPVIDMTYPGPQAPFAPVAFVDGFRSAALRDAQLIADLGFVVVAFDGRGCSGRDKAFRYAFAGTEDVFGSADHVAGITHLASTRPYLDLSRVGITGASYGGYGSARAILLHPEFFGACVATVGPADYRTMPSSISVERFFLNTDDPAEANAFFDLTSNTRLAERLTGALLLMYGEIDENVPLNQSFLMFEALQAAEKDYETVMLTNQPHAGAGSPYAVRQTARFFLERLGRPR
jgi:dipeptidyl aminopeptidase/acylaminoacyl peptidase